VRTCLAWPARCIYRVADSSSQLPLLLADAFTNRPNVSPALVTGRKHGMYGSGLKEAAEIDMVADGVESIKAKVRCRP
jgi:hypothetical protein